MQQAQPTGEIGKGPTTWLTILSSFTRKSRFEELAGVKKTGGRWTAPARVQSRTEMPLTRANRTLRRYGFVEPANHRFVLLAEFRGQARTEFR